MGSAAAGTTYISAEKVKRLIGCTGVYAAMESLGVWGTLVGPWKRPTCTVRVVRSYQTYTWANRHFHCDDAEYVRLSVGQVLPTWMISLMYWPT